MLIMNLWTEADLVNDATETMQIFLFKKDQGLPFFFIAIFISFDKYKGFTITDFKGIKVILITPV